MEIKLLGTLTQRKIGYGIVQPGDSIPNGVPVIKVNNIISGLHEIQDLDTTSSENSLKYNRTKLVGGELLVSVVGTIGKTAIVPPSFAGCNIVRAVAMIDIPNPEMALWVKYYIDSPSGKKYIQENLNTTVQPTLNVKSLVEMPIPLLEPEYMHNAIKILSTIDNKIELNNRINHNLEQQAQTLFKSWFVDFEPFKDGKFVDSEIGLIPEGWNVQPLSTILEYSKKSINPQKYPETIFTHYSLPAYDNSKEPEVQKGYEIMSNKFVVEENMILFSKLNPRIKRIWYIDDIPANSICSTEFIAYKALDTNAYPFCWCYLNSDMFYDKIMSSVNGATGSHQRFHAEETLDICFPYNKDAIQSFSTLIKPMLGSIVKNEAEIRVLKNERDFLLPQLMNGKMKVNN